MLYQSNKRPTLPQQRIYAIFPKNLYDNLPWYFSMRRAAVELFPHAITLVSALDLYHSSQSWEELFPCILAHVESVILFPDPDAMVGRGCVTEMTLANKAGKVRYCAFMHDDHEQGIRCVHAADSFWFQETGTRFKKVAYVCHDDSKALGAKQEWRDLKTEIVEEELPPPVEMVAVLPAKPNIKDLWNRYKGPGRPPKH